MLVVLAHAMCTESLPFKTIYAFHMPLFFIMSGYCFKQKYLSDFKTYFLRRIKGIYLPFVLYSLIFLSFHNVFVNWHLYGTSQGVYNWRDFLWIFSRITTRMSHNEQLLCVFWFLKELFWGSLIFYAALRFFKNKKIFVVVALLTISFVFRIFSLRIPYFSISFISFYAASFIAAGYWLKDYTLKSCNWWCVLICALIVALEVHFWGTSTMNVTTCSMIPYFLSGISGTMIIFSASSFICSLGKAKFFLVEYVGSHTLSIMALHLLSYKLISLLIICLYNLPLDELEAFPVLEDYNRSTWVLVYTFSGLFVPLLCQWFYSKIMNRFFKQ